MSLYILITENIYIKSIYFAVIHCDTTLAGLINSHEKHIDAGPTRTVLSRMLCRAYICVLICKVCAKI